MKSNKITRGLAMTASVLLLAGEVMPVFAGGTDVLRGGYSPDVEITAEVTEEDINEETLPEEESVSDDQAIMISDPNSGDSAISADTAEEIIKMDEEENGDVLQFDMEESDSASEEAKADGAGEDPWGTLAPDWYTRYEYTLSGNEIILEKRAVSVNDGVRTAVDIYDNSVDVTGVDGGVFGRDFYVTIPGSVEIEGKTYNVVLKPQWYLTHETKLDKVTSNAFHEYNVYHMKLKSGVSFYENSAAGMFESKVLDRNQVAFGGLSGYQWHPDEVVFDHVDFSKVTSMYGMFSCFGSESQGSDVYGYTKIDFGKDIDTSAVTRMDYMFYGCYGLTNLDLSGFDTSAVTAMDYMFCDCRRLTELDLSSFNTANVGNGTSYYRWVDITAGNLTNVNYVEMPGGMSYMFSGCSELTKLNISSFDTKNVKNMSYMFSGCAKLEGLDLTKFDTSSVSSQYIVDTYSNGQGVVKGTTGMSGMFSGCSKLKKLDLSSFNTSGVRSMDGMFSACSSLGELDISSFDTSAVADIPYPKNCDENGRYSFGSMAHMFSGCSSLKELDVSGFNTSGVTDMSGKFSGCLSLKELDVSGFNTSGVTDMSGMFSGCLSLKELDLSSFDLSKIRNSKTVMFGEWEGSGSYWGSYGRPCVSLERIVTPCNLPEGVSIELPYTYFDSSDTAYTELPHSAGSMVLTSKEAGDNSWIKDFDWRMTSGDGKIRLNSVYDSVSENVMIKGKLIIKQQEYTVWTGSINFPENVRTVSFSDGVQAEDFPAFNRCHKGLNELDMSGLDVSNLKYESGLNSEDNYPFPNLNVIKTPVNLSEGVSIKFQYVKNWRDGVRVVYVDADGKEYTEFPHLSYSITLTRKGNSGGGKEEPTTGDMTVNGEKVSSLKAAFKGMKDPNTDYIVELGSDVSGEKNLTIPKTAKSVTVKGNGHKINIVGTKIASGTKLILEDVTFSAANKKGVKAKFSVNAKKGLVVNAGVGFDASSVTVKVGGDFELNAELNANNVSTTNLILNSGSKLTAAAGYKISVKNLLKGNGGEIELAEGFNKPVSFKGTVEGKIVFNGAKQADGTQLIKANAKKLSAEVLKASFDVTEITDNDTDTYLYYLSSGKACIFGESISYNGENYALWKDVVAKMNADKASDYVIELYGDVNVKGALKLPKKGYQSLTINGNGHTLTFTGNIKLTGNTVVKDTVLKKVDKKGRQQSGRVVKGKFTYEGPETF